jgi:ABC-type transporter Mla MlaB component
MGAGVVKLAIRSPLERGDLPGLFERTCALLQGAGAGELRCEVAGVAADAVSVDALARLALAARRQGCRVQLCGASAELRALVAFLGLADVLREAPTPPDGAEVRTAGRSARSRGRR